MTITTNTSHPTSSPPSTPRSTPVPGPSFARSLTEAHRRRRKEQPLFQSMRNTASRNSSLRMWTPIQIHKAKLKTSTVSSVEQSWTQKARDGNQVTKMLITKWIQSHFSSSDTLECDEPKFPPNPVPTPGMEYYNILFEDTKDHFYRMAS